MEHRLPGASAPSIEVTDKGLRKNALSFLSNLVIGVASAAPAYSIASALGPIAGSASFATPAVLIVAFIPMLFIAVAYYYLNRADPDCGTTFSWVTLAMGPGAGWIGGWVLLMTNVIVMPSMAVIAGQYSFLLFGRDPSAIEVTAAGVAWIVVLTAICYVGIELSARTQQLLVGTEVAVLVLFAAMALAKVYTSGAMPGATPVSLDWFNPFKTGSYDGFLRAFLVAVFIYWGWDSSLAVNEETENPKTAPGLAAVTSTFLLVAVYVLVSTSALAFAGPGTLSAASDTDAGGDIFGLIGERVLGAWLDKLLILAVLTSAAAATQTTILPAARTALSMASAGAFPARFAEINPRFKSPGFATLTMGAVSILWFVFLRSLSKHVLDDSIDALGLCVAFYYGLTGFACVIVYRRQLFESVRNFALMGAIPALGGVTMVFLLVESALSLARKAEGPAFGIGVPLIIASASLVSGIILMLAARLALPAFFRRKALL